MIPGLLELAACLGVSWVVARWVDWAYRGNEDSVAAAEPPGTAAPGATVLTRS